MDTRLNYYSIHGSYKSGWTLKVYKVEPLGHVTGVGEQEPQHFDNIKDVLEEIQAREFKWKS